MKAIHFVGIFGSGMSAIAQYLAKTGEAVTGSDRLGNSSDAIHTKSCLEALGCKIFSQDGTGITKDTKTVVVSTAIEDSNPDIAAAKAQGIPILHRSDVLAAIIQSKKSLVIAGTSGKSTVTAMVFELLKACGKDPSLISGAALRSLQGDGAIGNAYVGTGDFLVVEGDESDGSLVKYEPMGAVVLNLSKDHKPEAVVLEMFQTLSKKSQWCLKNKDDRKLDPLEADLSFGFLGGDYTAVKKEGGLFSTTLQIEGHLFTVAAPGDHNASNLLAALAVCQKAGCGLEELALAAPAYQGVDRRFVVHETFQNVTVIDDFAHNPEKIRAALLTAKKFSKRVVALFQPHGFGPTRFLKDDYAAMFVDVLEAGDTLIMLPIYYAGGTATKDISSQDLIDLMTEGSFRAFAPNLRTDAIDIVQSVAGPGDAVLVMGARDPSLSAFIKTIVATLNG